MLVSFLKGIYALRIEKMNPGMTPQRWVYYKKNTQEDAPD